MRAPEAPSRPRGRRTIPGVARLPVPFGKERKASRRLQGCPSPSRKSRGERRTRKRLDRSRFPTWSTTSSPRLFDQPGKSIQVRVLELRSGKVHERDHHLLDGTVEEGVEHSPQRRPSGHPQVGGGEVHIASPTLHPPQVTLFFQNAQKSADGGFARRIV